MIVQKTEGDLLIISGSADADQAEVERLAIDGLTRRMRVNIIREQGGQRTFVGALQRVRDGFRMRGHQASDTRRTPEAAVRLALARFSADALGALA